MTEQEIRLKALELLINGLIPYTTTPLSAKLLLERARSFALFIETGTIDAPELSPEGIELS